MQVVEQVGSALEAFKRNRLLDAVTWDDDKLTPVYKMDEICEFVDSANVDVIKDMQEYLIRRLDHKSPWVKQKVLRLIKYMSGKAGHVWKREMQRHSSSIRPLFHHTGSPDPLRGDAPNKAVRELAHEAVTAIFAQEEKKSSAPEGPSRRIQGFGSGGEGGGGGGESLSSGKAFGSSSGSGSRSGMSGMMGFGSGSFGSGLSLGGSFSGGASKNSNSKSFRGPSSRRPLNADGSNDSGKDGAADSASSYRGVEAPRDTAPGVSGNSSSSRQWGAVTSNRQLEEDKLVEELTTPGGVRVQPTKDQLQSFVVSVTKLDSVAVATALEGKLQEENWQVRLRALCAIESVMRNTSSRPAEIFFNFFYEDASAIVDCLSMSQASVRDKAKKLLELLGQEGEADGAQAGTETGLKSANGGLAPPVMEMPDLLDTSDPEPSTGGGGQGGPDLLLTKDVPRAAQNGAPTSTGDLLGEDFWGGSSSSAANPTPPPVATASTSSGPLPSSPTAESEDIFAGLTINNPVSSPSKSAANINGAGGNGEDLFAGMQVNGNLGSNGTGAAAGHGRTSNSSLPMSPSAPLGPGSDLFEGMQINDVAGRSGGGGGFFSPPTSPLRAAPGAAAAGAASLADLVGPLSSLDVSGMPGGAAAAADTGSMGRAGAKPKVDPLQAYNTAPAGAPTFPGVMPGTRAMPAPGGPMHVAGGATMQVPTMMAMPPMMMGGMVPQQFVYIPNGQGGYLPQMMPAMAMPGFYPGGAMAGAGGAAGYAFMPQVGLGPGGGFAALQRSGSLGNGGGTSYADGFDFSGDPTMRLPAQGVPEVNKEQVKAFDFVSEHLSAARAPSKKPLRS